MSFSSDVKAEIAADIPSARHCRTASIAAILSDLGRFEQEENGDVRLFLNMDNPDAGRKFFTLVNKTFNIRNGLCISADKGCREARGWVPSGLPTKITGELARRLKLIGSDGRLRNDGRMTVSPELLKRKCCRRHYLRDLFIWSGIVLPQNRYHS